MRLVGTLMFLGTKIIVIILMILVVVAWKIGMILVHNGGGKLVTDENLTAKQLKKIIKKWYKERIKQDRIQQRKRMKQAMKRT